MVAAEQRTPDVRSPTPGPQDGEQRVYLSGLRWKDYEILLAIRGDNPRPRMTYREGVLELMSPGRFHETIKKNLARLLEMWAFQRRVRITGYGSWTLKDEAVDRGVEPDECYILGPDPERRDRPDLAIEVVYTSGGIDKLDVYDKLGVDEVWIWRDGALTAWRRRSEGDGYDRVEASVLLPDCDLALLAELATRDQNDALDALVSHLNR